MGLTHSIWPKAGKCYKISLSSLHLIAISVLPSTMELNSRSVTDELAADCRKATNALLPSHQVELKDGVLVDNSRDGHTRLQD